MRDLFLRYAHSICTKMDILALVTVPWDVGAHAFSFHDYPSLFKQDKIVVAVSHMGVFGAQEGFKSAETRVVLPVTEDVFECVDHIEKGEQAEALKAELRKLQADLRKRKRKHGAIGAACCDVGRSSKRQRWYDQDRKETRTTKKKKKKHQQSKKHQHQAPWRSSGNGTWGCEGWAKSSKKKTKTKKHRSWRRR